MIIKLVKHSNREEWVYETDDGARFKRVSGDSTATYWLRSVENIEGEHLWQGVNSALSKQLEQEFQDARARAVVEYEFDEKSG